MNKKRSSFNEITLFAIGEIIVTALTVAGFFVLDFAKVYHFGLDIVLGAVLGCVAILINYAVLCSTVNRAINNFIELRHGREMDEEEAMKFAREHSAKIQNAMKSSMMIRTFSLAAALIVAFLTGWFDPFATAIPMLAFRPIISLMEIVRRKYDTPPNPDEFIKYDYEDEIDEEKEDE